jgi:hypothetical protein
MLFNYVLAFISGFFVKWVDWIEDDRKGKGLLKFPLAVLYGILIGYLISQATFSELFLGALIAQVFARKIDNISHVTGFFASVAALLYFGLPAVNPEFFVYFLILAFLDEQKYPGRYELLSRWRMFLKTGAVMTILLGRYDFAIAILLFDAGYMLFSEVRKIFFPEIAIPKPEKKRKRFKKRKS